MSPVSCEKLTAAREWLEASAKAFGLTADLPRSLEELLKLQEQIKAEREVANRHARCVRELKTKVLKKPRRVSIDTGGDAATAEASRRKTTELVEALCARVEAAESSAQLLRLVEHLRDTLQHWPEDQHCHLSPVLEAADRRMESLQTQEAAMKAAQAEEAREEKEQEEELRKLRESKEALLEQLKEARSQALLDGEAMEEGESTSASQEQAPSEPSSRSNSDVGLRSETVSPPRPDMRAPAVAERSEPAVSASAEERLNSSPSDLPTQRPAGGKGKSKGIAPPKAKAKPKATANLAPRSTNNGFQNFFWQVIKENQDRECGKDFLTKFEALKPSGCSIPETPEIPVPKPPETIFKPLAEVPQVPMHVLEHFWKKRESHIARTRACDGPNSEELAGKASILDEKKLQMLGITLKRHEHHLRKHRMQREEISRWEAIASIKQAILRCDFEILQIECLSVIRTVIKQHENDGKPVTVFAEANGEAALRSCRCPEGHCLVFELCKVPQIVDRLECMVFHETFRDNLRNYQQALTTHHQALSMLNGKRQTIEQFFVTALRLGQSLNRSSKASQAPHGFELGSLEKLAETKSTKLPKLSVFHFVLALMRDQDVASLANDEDMNLLQEAAMRKTHKVYQDCIELVQGLYSVQNICDTGEYIRPDGEAVTIQRRRRTLVPKPSVEEADLDDDDLFFEVMHQFVKDQLEAAEDIAESGFNLLLLYKELAIYFDDMRNVYPPPKSENDSRRDLVEVFARFTSQIRRHREQVESENLRELIRSSQRMPTIAG